MKNELNESDDQSKRVLSSPMKNPYKFDEWVDIGDANRKQSK